jgi:hypothetical protein
MKAASAWPKKTKLSDAEVLTIETGGEYSGIDTDEGLYAYFGCHYQKWLPALPQVHCTTFACQAGHSEGADRA